MGTAFEVKDIIDDPLTTNVIITNIFDKIANWQRGAYFHSSETRTAMKKYIETLKEDKQGDRECAIQLWKELLIDAICLLKINDARERLYSLGEKNIDEFSDNFEKIRNISSFGISSLEEYFNDFVEFEAVLYTEKYYRDHIHHVIQVWGLGIGLLFCSEDKRISLKFSEDIKYANRNFHKIGPDMALERGKEDPETSKEISRTELWAMWTIISLCHDLGYPLEKASKINQKVKNIVAHFGCKDFIELNFKFDIPNTPLIEKFLKIISSKTIEDNNKTNGMEQQNTCSKDTPHPEDKGKYHTEVQQKYYDKFSKSLEEYRHGMFSGFLLFKVLVYFLETDFSPHKNTITAEDRRQFLIRREMLRAICCHTCPTIYHINLNTLSFLLILCDEIQEWNRPRFDDLYCTTEEDSAPRLRIKTFSTKEEVTTISISAKYDACLGTQYKMMEATVISKYKMFVYLLRSAKDDGNRKINFSWEIEFKDYTFKFIFDTEQQDMVFSTSYQKIEDTEKPFDLFKKDICKEILDKQS